MFAGCGLAMNSFSIIVISSVEFLRKHRIMAILLAFLIGNNIILCANAFIGTEHWQGLTSTDTFIHSFNKVGKSTFYSVCIASSPDCVLKNFTEGSCPSV